MACNLVLTEPSGGKSSWMEEDGGRVWDAGTFDARLLVANRPSSDTEKVRAEGRLASLFHCPWCGGPDLLEGAQAGWWCLDCEGLAWFYTATGIVRGDQHSGVPAAQCERKA